MDVYVEWPLASKLSQAGELVALAKEKGVRTVTGLQRRFAPKQLTTKPYSTESRIAVQL